MKDSLFDQVLVGVEDVVNKVSGGIAEDFKGKRPFDTEPVSSEKLMESYVNLTPFEKNAFAQRYGQDALDFFSEMERKLILYKKYHPLIGGGV